VRTDVSDERVFFREERIREGGTALAVGQQTKPLDETTLALGTEGRGGELCEKELSW
jgi:hypothetical protein